MRISCLRLAAPSGNRISAGANWISTFRYGFEGSPVFGCFHDAAGGASSSPPTSSSSFDNRSGDTLQRYAYCKALVYASSGGRLARDWIAGCASLSVSDAELVALALQHDASKDDLLRFQVLLERRRSLGTAGNRSSEDAAQDIVHGNHNNGVKPPVPEFFPAGFRTPSLSALSPGTSHPDDDDDASIDQQQLTPLTGQMANTVLRCFVYDAVKAASFHTTSLLPEQVLHLEHVCATLGLVTPQEQAQELQQQQLQPPRHPKAASSATVTPVHFLQAVIDIVTEENAIMKEKFRVIEQQGSRN